MSMPDHPIWNELENYFRTPLAGHERKQIIDVIKHALGENPGVDLDELTLSVTVAILKRRAPSQERR